MNVPNARRGDGFGRLAYWYSLLEWIRFGRRLQRARCACLDELNLTEAANRVGGRPPRALFLGDGDGKLLHEFASRVHDWEIVSVDLSNQMLVAQQNRLRNTRRRNTHHFVQADSRKLPIAADFDVVFAAFHLDCFCPDELRSVIDQVHQRLCNDGLFYVVDFVVPRHGWRRWWAQAWLGVFICFFRFATGYSPDRLPDHRGQLDCNLWSTVVERITDGWISTLVVRRQPMRHHGNSQSTV